MQTNFFPIIPAKFPSLTKLSPTHQIPSPANIKPPRVIPISTPKTGHVVNYPRLETEPIDDTVTALSDYQFLFVSQRSETVEPIALKVIDGAIPSDFPSGTYYLTGPGLFTDDHGSTVHPLDGHGYLRAFHIDGVTGQVKFMAKYVKTEALMEEHDAETDTWRFTNKGAFSMLKGGQSLGNMKMMKNVANATVLKWGKKLLCLWEGGESYEIDSETLDTIGMFDMIKINGRDSSMNAASNNALLDVAASLLKPILSGVFKMPAKRMLSHYKIDPLRNRLLTMSCNAEDMLLPRSNFTFYEFDTDMKLLQKREFDISDHLMIHDWAFTDTHYVLFANRIKLDVIGSLSAVCGMSPTMSTLTVNPSKSTSPIYLLPRFPHKSVGNRDWRVPVEAPSQRWLLHSANAFETTDERGNLEIQILYTACSYQWFSFQKLFGYNWKSGKLDPSLMNLKEQENDLPHLFKMSIKLGVNGRCQKCSIEPLNKWRKSADFPAINPSFSGYKNKHTYAATTSGSRRTIPNFPFDTVMKLNSSDNSVRTWFVGARKFIGEPMFVPKRGGEEDDGYLLVVEYAVAIQRCYLVVLNAKRIGKDDAMVARLEVPKHLNFPFGFHGFWSTHP